MKIQHVQQSFSSGELSPLLVARTDINPYITGAKTVTNAYVLSHGGLRKRGGLVPIKDVVVDSSRKIKLIPFIYDNDNSYVLVLNAGKITFIKQKDYIRHGSTSVNPNTQVQINHPYVDQELDEITYTQYQSVMYICHVNHPPKQLVRENETTWKLTDIDITYEALSNQVYDNGYVRFKIISTPYTSSRTTSSQNNTYTGTGSSQRLVSSTSTSNIIETKRHFKINDYFQFVTDGAGNATSVVTRLTDGADVGYIVVIGVDNKLDKGETWTVKLIYRDDVNEIWSVNGSKSGNVKLQWREKNYPAVACFHEQRLFFAGTRTDPLRIWGSTIGSFQTFTLGQNDKGLQFDIDNNTRDNIINLESTRVLLPLTHNAEYTLAGSDQSGITSQTVNIKRQTTKGSIALKAKQVNDELLFIDRTAKIIRAISYDFQTDSFTAPDLSIMSNHLSQDGYIDITYDQSKNIVWLINKNGKLISMTHIREQALTGMTKHEIKQGSFEALTCIPEGNVFATYVVTKQKNQFYISYMDDDVYVDQAELIEKTTETDTFEVDFPEDTELAVHADGKHHPPVKVKLNSVTNKKEIKLQYKANKIQVGYGIEMEIQMFEPIIATRGGISMGLQVSIVEPEIFLADTIGLKVNGKEIITITDNDKFGVAPKPVNGSIKMLTLGWDNFTKVTHDYTQPCTVLGVSYACVIGTS